MPKASPQGRVEGEQEEVGIPHEDKILKGKEKSVGKKARHCRPRQNRYQQKAESSSIRNQLMRDSMSANDV